MGAFHLARTHIRTLEATEGGAVLLQEDKQLDIIGKGKTACKRHRQSARAQGISSTHRLAPFCEGRRPSSPAI
jgi:hypothetical protein